MKKSRQEFVDYMWMIYPHDNDLERRTAMLKAYEFLTGVYDSEEKDRLKLVELMSSMTPKYKENIHTVWWNTLTKLQQYNLYKKHFGKEKLNEYISETDINVIYVLEK